VIFEKVKSRKGQSTVEAALIVPLFTIVAFIVIQYGWVMYTASTLTYACTHAQYVIAPEDVVGTVDMNELVREKMIDSAPMLQSGTLTVSNAKIESLPTKYETIDLPDSEFDEYLIASKNEKTVRLKVSADVEYRPVVLFGVTPQSVYTRHIESSKITSETFELA